jgi:hypothetical protein
VPSNWAGPGAAQLQPAMTAALAWSTATTCAPKMPVTPGGESGKQSGLAGRVRPRMSLVTVNMAVADFVGSLLLMAVICTTDAMGRSTASKGCKSLELGVLGHLFAGNQKAKVGSRRSNVARKSSATAISGLDGTGFVPFVNCPCSTSLRLG